MSITVDTTRPKAETTKAIALAMELGAAQENDTNDSFFVPVNATGLTIPDFAVADITITSGSDILTTTDGGFSEVQVGDAIAAGTAIGAVTVIAKTDDNTIQVSADATANGTETLTFTPSTGGTNKTITLAGIEITLIVNAQGTITARFTGHTYDGSLGDTLGTNANSASQLNLNEFNIDLDSILESARIPKEN